MTLLDVAPRIQIPLAELEFTYVRSSGPGGQNVNKVSSKAVLRYALMRSPSLPDDVRGRFIVRYRARLTGEGELLITSQRYRDAPRNREDCLEKLKQLLLSVAAAPKARKPVGVTRKAKARRRRDKAAHSEKKQSRRLPRGD